MPRKQPRSSPRWFLLLCLLAVLGAAAVATAQASVSFRIVPETGGFSGAPVRTYGDVDYVWDQNADPPWASAAIVPNIPSSPTSRYGALYYRHPVDLSRGFTTRFFTTNAQGIAFIIKNPSTTPHYVPTGSSPSLGYTGLAKSVAVALRPQHHSVSLDVPASDGILRPGQSAGNGTLTPRAGGGMAGEVILRYSPRSGTFEVYYQPAGSFDTRILLVKNFDLADYGVLENGMAEIGFSAGAVSTGQSTVGGSSVTSWEFGNNLNFSGITSAFYSELMTFKTTGQGVWNPQLVPDARYRWDLDLIKRYGPRNNASPSRFNDTWSKLGFEAGIDALAEGEVGLRFQAEASGGTVDVCYPLYLNLAFPRQKSLSPGETVEIIASYEPDVLASFTTKSPSARFQSFLTFNTHTHFSTYFDPPLFDGISFSPFDHTRTTVQDKAFLDTDFIWKNRQLFGLGAGLAGGFVNLQDDEGAAGPKGSRRGQTGTGSTTGAKKGVSPADFISLNLRVPTLNVSGTLRPGFDRIETAVGGQTQSPFIGLHADFTSALLALAGLGALGNAINYDQSLDLGGDWRAEFGWHFADLYGDIDLGIRMKHDFAPKPQLYLLYTDGAETSGMLEVALDNSGKPVDVPALPMTDRPLTITPVVYLANPGVDPLGRPISPSRAFNSFKTDGELKLDGSLALNAFQIYVDIPKAGIDVDTQSNPEVIKPFQIPLFDVPIAGSKIAPFELKGFNVVRGKSYTIYPKNSPNPILHSASPNTSPTFASDASGDTVVMLETDDADADVRVLWNDDPSGLVLESSLIPAARTQWISRERVRISLPNTMLTQRGVHTLTLLNGYGTLNTYRSNVVSFTVNAPQPAAASLSPAVVTLGARPVDAAGNPVLIDVVEDGTLVNQYFNLTVNGSGFVGPINNPDGSLRYAGTAVRWNGEALPTEFLSPAQVRARVPAVYIAEAGIVPISVINSGLGGGESAPLSFTAKNPLPKVTALSHSTVRGLPAFSLTITGSGFVPGTTLSFKRAGGGSASPELTFISASQLAAELQPLGMAEGTYTVHATNPGPGGGTSTTFQTLLVDTTTPATTATLSGPEGSGGWYRGPVTVTLNAADSLSGVEKLYYTVGDGERQEYTGPFTLSEEGEHSLAFYAVDRAGNEEASNTRTVPIDRTVPVTTASAPGLSGGVVYAESEPVPVTLEAADNLSGVEATYYTLNGGAPKVYGGTFKVSGFGQQTVRYWSVDAAGNEEGPKTITVYTDNTPPVVTAAADPAELWPANGRMVEVTVSGKVTDNLSGVDLASGRFAVADEYRAVQPYGSFTIAADGSYSFRIRLQAGRNGSDRDGRKYTVTVRAKDRAGNPGLERTLVIVPHDQRK